MPFPEKHQLRQKEYLFLSNFMYKSKNAFARENVAKRGNDMALKEWMYVNNTCERLITVKNCYIYFKTLPIKLRSPGYISEH